MIIAIGSDGNSLQNLVSKRFGHASYYLVYNSDSKHLNIIENIDDDHSHKLLSDLIDLEVQYFIVGNVGPHAFNIISTENTKVYLARNMSVKSAIDLLLKGELKELTEPTVKKNIDHNH